MAAPVNAGDVLGGKYRVERVLGEGGMGVVVAATHMQLQERVALKFLLVELTNEAETVTRFLREAQAAVKIKSEHVARVTDVGTLESGAPYMVMEYLEGQDLAARIEQKGRLPLDEAIEYLLQACEALAEAHRAGIVHRDLKPANLFLTSRSDGSHCIKVLDFGISKLSNRGLGGVDAGLTKTTGIMGTPYYMSPEQLRSSRDVDVRTDIWSLGVVLFELLTADLPFHAESVPDLCVAVLTKPAQKIRFLRPEIPEPIEAIILRCLKKDPSDRFGTVSELAQALAPFASEQGRRSVTRIVRTSNPDLKPGAAFARQVPPASASGSGASPIVDAVEDPVKSPNTEATMESDEDALPGIPPARPRVVLFAAGGALLAAVIALVLFAARAGSHQVESSPVLTTSTEPSAPLPTGDIEQPAATVNALPESPTEGSAAHPGARSRDETRERVVPRGRLPVLAKGGPPARPASSAAPRSAGEVDFGGRK